MKFVRNILAAIAASLLLAGLTASASFAQGVISSGETVRLFASASVKDHIETALRNSGSGHEAGTARRVQVERHLCPPGPRRTYAEGATPPFCAAARRAETLDSALTRIVPLQSAARCTIDQSLGRIHCGDRNGRIKRTC